MAFGFLSNKKSTKDPACRVCYLISLIMGEAEEEFLSEAAYEREDIEAVLAARHTDAVQNRLKKGVVGVMGLGGLGSAVTMALARIGVGTLLLADYDIVELSNLHRQDYFLDQVGFLKTEALKQNISRINPFIRLVIIEKCLTEAMILHYFQDVDVLVECFDRPEMKAIALRVALTSLPGVAYVGASGVAGFGGNNLIKTKKIGDQVYLVGDGESAIGPDQVLMAPRVGIAAHHQANQVVRLLLGKE